MQTGIDHLSMFLLGLMGSGHCLGMCGPLVIVLPGSYRGWQAHAMYHAGRLITYTAAGGVLGALGQGLVRLSILTPHDTLVWAGRIQMAISLPVALFLLVLGLNRVGLLDEPGWMTRAAPQCIPGYGRVFQRVLNRQGAGWLFPMGLMLGFLPCGLSYGAFARALPAGGAGQGALLAAFFGLGTLPALMLLGTGAGLLWQRFRPQAEIMAGLIMLGMAVSLLVNMWTAIA
ncbi:MAG: sulfite exporter TauE/SafE family protein [Desulfobacteraceae bacterium]|nr:MAG: sulfite exporter TauE/SafE family protein [Desulfobacteraceae bacterium]